MENMIEAVSKTLDALAKYSWGIVAVCIFVLFLPDVQARQIGIIEIRSTYQGYWWICLVFSSVIWLGSIYSKFSAAIATTYGKSKAHKAQLAKVEEKKQTIINRLYSLNESEQKWIAYCLINNVQTLHATQINPTANSLFNKDIVTGGSGNRMSLPFTLIDFVWEHMLTNSDNLLPANIENDAIALRNLEQFKQSLTKIY